MNWKATRHPLEHQLTAADQQISRLSRSRTLEEITSQGQALGEAWADMSLERQHAIMPAV